MKRIALAGFLVALFAPSPGPEYSIEAIRYATLPQFPTAALVMGAPKAERLDIAMVVWLIRGSGRTILFDSGFHREKWFKDFPMKDFLRPDEALAQAGVKPEDVSDIIISHAHWDHMGGIDLFPLATVWIQKEEFGYYTGAAWQPGGRHGGIDPEDVVALVRLNTEGRLRLVDGDNVEILPGIRAYTGARHTYASQYIRVDGKLPFVLASDNCYLYRNLETHAASATFSEADRAGNLKAQERMVDLAGARERVVPGHDALQFARYPTEGRVASIGPIAMIEAIARSHIEANIPKGNLFDRYLQRDLNAYFCAKFETKNCRVDYELLRVGPTQSGIAYPKYYAWAKCFTENTLRAEGAVRLAAIEQQRFEVTDFLSREEIVASP